MKPYRRTCAFSFSLRFICKSQRALCSFFFSSSPSEFNSHPRLSHFVSVCARHGQISLRSFFFPSVSFKLLLFPVAFLRLAAPLCSDLDDVDSFVFLFVWLFFFCFLMERSKTQRKLNAKWKCLFCMRSPTLIFQNFCSCFVHVFGGFVPLMAEKTNLVNDKCEVVEHLFVLRRRRLHKDCLNRLTFPDKRRKKVQKLTVDLSHHPCLKHVPEF